MSKTGGACRSTTTTTVVVHEAQDDQEAIPNETTIDSLDLDDAAINAFVERVINCVSTHA